MPEGAARWIAPIPLSAQGCAVSGTQAEVADFSGRTLEKRNAKGVFFGLPFLHEQER
jgi:hypothetical protein